MSRPPYDSSDARYGRVQDDGTVKEYPSQRAAERAGPIEAIVCWWPEHGVWVYPATGREYSRADVAGLSPATASEQAWKVLGDAHLSRKLPKDNGIISRALGASHMETTVQVQKCAVRPSWPEEVSEVLMSLPGAVRATQPHQGDEWNYHFVTLMRRRS